MDISATLEANSDQMDAVDLTEPRDFTIERVTEGSKEQPVNVHMVEFPKPWRPSKNMRRVLAACWGKDASQWVGRTVRLYCDPTVVYGKQAVGGIRVEALSHIGRPRSVAVLLKRGQSAVLTIRPLEVAAPKPAIVSDAQITNATDVDTLRGLWQSADPMQKKAIEARVKALTEGEKE